MNSCVHDLGNSIFQHSNPNKKHSFNNRQLDEYSPYISCHEGQNKIPTWTQCVWEPFVIDESQKIAQFGGHMCSWTRKL